MMLGACGEPHSIVSRRRVTPAQDENDLLADINREAAEHRIGVGPKRSKPLEDELERNVFHFNCFLTGPYF